MAAIVYPSTLPGPLSAPFQPTERRLLSSLPNGPRQARPMQRDRHAGQQLDFIYSHAELATFEAWLADNLVRAGAWFAASWPQPQGGVGVRRYVGEPSFPVYYPNVGWHVSADVEVRGRGAFPDDRAPSGDTLALFNRGAFVDQTSYHHDLTSGDAEVAGGAMVFSGDGATSFALGGPHPLLALPLSGWTVQTWVNIPASQPQRFPTIYEVATGGTSEDETLFVRFDCEGHLDRFELNVSSGGGLATYSTGTYGPAKYHLCVMGDPLRGTALWVGGERVTVFLSSANYSAGGLYLLLGSQFDGLSVPSDSSGFLGSITSFKVSAGLLFGDTFTPPAEPLRLDY